MASLATFPAMLSFGEDPITVLHHLQIVRYLTVAALAFNLWDYCITFQSEIHLVWVASASGVKLLFIINRYLGPAILIVNVRVLMNHGVTDDICNHWFRLEGWGGLVVVLVVQVILILRVTALYERSITISRLLVILLLGHVVASSTILALALPKVKPLERLGPVFLGCVTPAIPSFFFALFVPHLVVETTLFGLTVAQSLKSLPKGDWHSAPMFVLLLRDGTIYFFVMFAITCITTFTWVFAPPSLMKIGIAPLIAISSVSGCRIIINLRSLHMANDHNPPELNLATFDLGDLELRTLPIGLRSTGPPNILHRTTSDFSGADLISRQSTTTMVDDMTLERNYIHDDEGVRRGKWETFDDAASISGSIPGYERRAGQPGVGGWRRDFIDIRRESHLPPPAPPLPVPPATTGHVRSASSHVQTRCGTPSDLERHQRRPSIPESNASNEGERSPLSPHVQHSDRKRWRSPTWI